MDDPRTVLLRRHRSRKSDGRGSAVIEKKMKSMAKQNLPYRREDIEKAKILDIFEERDEPLKAN
jgi:hypothetical protein